MHVRYFTVTLVTSQVLIDIRKADDAIALPMEVPFRWNLILCHFDKIPAIAQAADGVVKCKRLAQLVLHE